jgi:hypothetical protein
MTASAVPTQRSARGGIPRFGRLQTIGLLYGLLGVLLTAYVAPNIEAADKGFTFEVPPNPATFTFDPRTLVLAFGLFFVLTAVVSMLGPRYERWTRALLVSTILLAPLIVILSLALSAQDTNVIQLIVESLRLGTPIALGDGGLWAERSGVVNIAIEA